MIPRLAPIARREANSRLRSFIIKVKIRITIVSPSSQNTMMRTDTAMNRMGSSTYTRYFVTFELENGGRVELGVKDSEYGMLAEGDQGLLTY